MPEGTKNSRWAAIGDEKKSGFDCFRTSISESLFGNIDL